MLLISVGETWCLVLILTLILNSQRVWVINPINKRESARDNWIYLEGISGFYLNFETFSLHLRWTRICSVQILRPETFCSRIYWEVRGATNINTCKLCFQSACSVSSLLIQHRTWRSSHQRSKNSFIPENDKVMIIWGQLEIGSFGSHSHIFIWFNLSTERHTDSFIPDPFLLSLSAWHRLEPLLPAPSHEGEGKAKRNMRPLLLLRGEGELPGTSPLC